MWTATMPCNLNQRELADAVARGRRARRRGRRSRSTRSRLRQPVAGDAGDARVARLARGDRRLDRADVLAHDFDALVCIVGCDKTVPAALMALARIDKPAVVLYSGPMRAGRWRGEGRRSWTSGRRSARRRGRDARAELDELERSACPGPGTCAGNFTATTMGLALEFLGLAPSARRWCRRTTSRRRPAPPRAPGELAVRLGGAAADERSCLARLAAERDDRDRGERRVDQRRAPPARDRPRGRRRAEARGPARRAARRR